MGNTPPTPTNLRLSNSDHSYQLQIAGTSASIHFRGKEVTQSKVSTIVLCSTSSWEVSYMVDHKPTCTITLGTIILRTGADWGLCISIKEDNTNGHNFSIFVTKSGHQGLLTTPTIMVETPFVSSTTNNERGEVITTKSYFCGHGKRLSLLVSQWKRKSSDEDPYTGTMVHYYTNTENGQDIGLSVALKRIRVISGRVVELFDYAVDGPEQHPVAALLYMFDQVQRTKTWKPNLCPHCATNNITKMQRAGIWRFEGSEDSDIDNVVHAALVRGRGQQDARSGGGRGGLVANDGTFNGGHHNGNLKIKNLILALAGKLI